MASTIAEKSVIEGRLGDLESKIRAKAVAYQEIKETLRKAEEDLREAVRRYRSLREKAQRKVWDEKKLGWCQGCDKFHSQFNIFLLYVDEREHYGFGLYKRFRTFCLECSEKMLSRPRGGKSEFQCYKARRTKEEFEIFISGSWQPVPKLKKQEIETERDFIPQSEYIFGKEIVLRGFPPELKIDGETIAMVL